jgi:hypothetical protein
MSTECLRHEPWLFGRPGLTPTGHSKHPTCLSALLVTDRAIKAWYHPPLHE